MANILCRTKVRFNYDIRKNVDPFLVLVPIKYMPIFSAVVLFCFDKFEDNQNEKVVNIFPNVIVN